MAENEDWSLQLPAETADIVNQKRVIFSYTREFLLSLSDLDICKQLPSGLDPSILSDCQEVTQSAPEWRRPYGSSALQSSKRGENGLSSGTWVECSGNSSRGVHDKTTWQTLGSLGHGRWESRAGLTDDNGDQHSEKGSVAQDSSKRYGNQSRSSWQSPERDGLLGSGNFPRPSVHAGGPISPKVRGNGQHQLLNRTTEPYQPPWMYKPAHQSHRDTTDLCNDETFGSSECLSQDKAEEEKRRRASFEMMRKEQQKVLQEKLKRNAGKQNVDLSYLDTSEDEVNIQVEDEVDDRNGVPQNDNAKLSILQAPTSRPLVPPGFATSVLDKNQITRTSTLSAEPDVFKPGRSTAVEECLDTTGPFHTTREVTGQIKEKYLATDLEASAKQREVDCSIPTSMNGTEKPAATLLSEVSQSPLVIQTTQDEFQEQANDALTNLVPGKAASSESKIGASSEASTSILEKLFGSAMIVKDADLPNLPEASAEKADDEPWNPVTQSSKFAHWFCEEEVKPEVDQPPSNAENLLSLFASNEKGIPYDVETKKGLNKAAAIVHPEEAANIPEHVVQPLPTSGGDVSESSHSGKLDVRSGVLTCEDLEQFILAEVNASQTNIESSVKGFSNALNLGSEQQQTNVDNQASQHLLALLQKGKDSVVPSTTEEIAAVAFTQPISVDSVQLSEKTLTLETLFGTAFMQELQSVEAPVSVQRLSGVVRTTDLDLPGATIKPAPKIGQDSIPAAVYHGGERRYDTSKASWLGLDDPKYGINPKVIPSLGFDSESADDIVDVHLPEEESLITVSSTPTNEAPTFLSPGITSKEEILSTPVDIMKKLTGLNNTLKDDGSMIPAMDHRPLQEMLRGPFNMMGPEFQHQQHLLGGQSLPHFPMNPLVLRPPYSQLEQELNGHLERFMGPADNGFDPRHHFPPNVLQHPFHHNAGIATRFEPAQHQAMQHMVPSNLSAPHPLQPLPGGLPLQNQYGLGPFNNHVPPFMPDIHSVQGFPFHHRSPNFNAMEVPVPGSGGRSGHPEGLERLIEMELRANANKKPPFVSNPGGPPFGPEIDMAYRYR